MMREWYRVAGKGKAGKSGVDWVLVCCGGKEVILGCSGD